MSTTRRDFYTERTEALRISIGQLRRRDKGFIAAELSTFVVAVALVLVFTCVDSAGAWLLYMAAAMLALYVATRRMDVKNSEKRERLSNELTTYENELRYLDGDFSNFDNGERYIDAKHEYAFDMDIFGPLSLYNRISRSVTTGGAERLAEKLATCAVAADTTTESITKRRDAITELANNEAWRTSFMALGQNGHIDTLAIKDALEGMRSAKVSFKATGTTPLAMAWTVVAGFWLTVALALFTSTSADLPLWWGVIQFALVFTACSASLRSMSKSVGKLHNQLKAYVGLMHLMATLDAKTDINKALTAMANKSDGNALTSLKELNAILDSLDRRGNVLGMVLFNIMFLSDFFLVRRFQLWQKQYMGTIEAWIDAISEMDALVSMATFRYNEPYANDATVIDGDLVVYEGEGLYHPFLGEKAVTNDFSIVDGNYYIITGANMAGKSTFLRTLGMNYILAMAGMPVFAKRLRLTVFSLFSSMRTSDDLAHGVSYFNAELLRLQQLIDSCKRHKHTLIILDEILKGTNSLDKLNGSRMFLDAISTMAVSGVIATHDLELSKMADKRPDRFHNYCFEINLSDDITYTYKIAPGVARNQNASFLLRKIIASIN